MQAARHAFIRPYPSPAGCRPFQVLSRTDHTKTEEAQLWVAALGRAADREGRVRVGRSAIHAKYQGRGKTTGGLHGR